MSGDRGIVGFPRCPKFAWLVVGLCMRLIVYNPYAAGKQDRLEDISQELRLWDVILLSGVHAWQDSGQSMKTLETEYHWGVQWGGKKSLWVSKVCGVSILIRKGFACREQVV